MLAPRETKMVAAGEILLGIICGHLPTLVKGMPTGDKKPSAVENPGCVWDDAQTQQFQKCLFSRAILSDVTIQILSANDGAFASHYELQIMLVGKNQMGKKFKINDFFSISKAEC